MGEISGLYFAKNVFSNGAVVMGAKNKPDWQNVYLSNQFVDAPLQIGVSQPGQCQVPKKKKEKHVNRRKEEEE